MIWSFILEHLGTITVTAFVGAAWTIYTQIDKKRVKLHITQSGCSITNQVYATELDMTGYRAEVKIINDSDFPVVLRGFDLQLPWNDEDFRFLPDPREGRHQRDYYEMPMTSLRWPMADVINHRTFTNGRMERGEVIEGFILAVGTTPIPAFYHHGDEIEMKFSVYDQRSTPHSIRLTFWVDVHARHFKMSAPELPEDSDPEAEEKKEGIKLALAETAKKQIKVVVIGTDHNIQRHQDTDPELEKDRADFEKSLRAMIEERKIDLITEEAGEDTEVWKRLKQEEEAVGKYAAVFGGGKTVDHAVSTIAKKIADERPGELRHVDIRAPNAEKLSITERDAAMAAKVKEVLGDTDSIVVIVGEEHRAGVAQRLKGEGMDVESICFPE